MPTKTPHYVEASLKYLESDGGLAEYVASVGGGDTTEHHGNYLMQPVRIQDGRTRQRDFDLDREGFVLIRSPSQVRDFYNDDLISVVYEPEVKSMIAAATGARRVEVFDHTRRSSSLEVQTKRNIRESASIIHSDYSACSGPQRLRDHFTGRDDDLESLLAGRFAIINAWRSIAGTVLQAPLTLCDSSSVAPDDMVPVTRKARDRIGEIQLATYNPSHRWYYFPNMEQDEVLLFKTFDSAEDGRARFSIHTAFEDPGTAPHAPPRESIETRCFVFF